MELREAYCVMQAASGIEKGDTVRVIRTTKKDEMGYNGSPTNCVKTVSTVIEVQEADGIELRNTDIPASHGTYWFPFFALEIVEKAKPEKMITINGKDWSEKTIAEALRNHAK
ncbi:hypothetical protein LCGC14_2037550 [marine sediment metagenome]|uniref:Uncharacterized protein n=1 Tax=marine sediment metagenome TaxID=412755 RepID=A0A0F9ET11_9ZZZZ